MKIAFNPSTVAALIAPPNNKDITFDLRGQNIFARGVKFCGTDTNTWRDIKINNVSIDSNTLDLRDGNNTTLTNTNGVVTINSTWRPVVDNLTSDSTTSSLSANLGRILKALIDGKSDSLHTHDDRYLRLTGGWMSGDINFGDDNKIYWGRNTDSASISFKNDGDGDADSYMSFVTSDNGNEYFRWSHSSGSTNTEWMALRSDGLRVGGTKVSLEGHSHNDLYYTKTEVNNKLNGKSDTDHTHDDRYLKLTGGTMSGTIYKNSGGSTISGRDHAIIRLTYAPGGSSWNPIACVDTETGTWTLGHLSSGDNDTNFHFCFSTNTDYNAGNNNGNYITLRNKVGTIALLSEIPDKNSWNYDDRYVKKLGDTMLGALNLANGTWNLVGDDSYMGDCNISGHFGIKAANTTYPGIAFFDNANAYLGNLTAYSSNIKYGAYSLQFLDNGNTSVSASTWMNPFSDYNSNAVADGQAICVWGLSSYFGNLANDTGDMSLWLKRVNANVATLNMVLDGEYYANGNLRLAHVSEIPSSLKNPYALTISLNGTSQGPYDGSAAKNINITPSSIGAATSDHNHDGRYVYNYGDTANVNGLALNQNALFMSTTSGITGDWWHILQAAWNGEYRWNSLIAFPTLNRNGMYYRSGLDDNTKWGSWVKLLDIGNSYVTGGKGVINGTTITQVDNADTIDDYHASSLWRSDGGIWNPSANITLNASGNGQEWSFDIYRNGYTDCYWHVWDSDRSTMLKVNADNGKVYAPYNFVGNLEGNASTATNTQNIRVDQYASTGEYPIIWADSTSSNANSNTISRLYKTWKYLYWTPNKKTLTLAGNGTKCAIGSAFDGNDRPGLHITGNYPELIMMSLNVSNTNHGSTIVLGAYTSNSDSETNYRAFAIGMNGPTTNEAFLDFGYGVNLANPHANGIANYGGDSFNNPYIMRLTASKRVFIQGVGDDLKPALLVNTYRNGGWVYTASFLAPNLTSNNNNAIFIGKAHNTCNAFGLTHMHIGDGSVNNYAALEVWGVGNVLRWYYDRHSSFLHRADFSSLGSDASYMNSALLIREHGYNGTQADTWANAPRMSWHWSGRVQTQIGLGSNNELYLSKNDFGNAYRLVYETGTWSINISGNATSATYPVGFTSRGTGDWSGVPGTLATDWSVNGADIMFKYDSSKLNVITDGRFYQGIDIYGASKRVLDEYDINHTTWGYASNSDTVDGYHATTGRTFNGNINWSPNWNDAWSDGTNNHPWYGFDHRYPNTGAYSTTITDYFGMTIKTANTLRLDFGTLLLNGTDITNINIASATKLQTPRSIWGQSFDGTSNVNGTLQIERASNFGNYNEGIRIVGNSNEWCVIMLGCKAGSYSGVINSQWELMKTASDTFRIGRGSASSSFLEIINNGNVGIGTTSPHMKLHVNGDGIYLNSTATCGINMYSSHGESSISYKSSDGIRTVFGTYKNRTFLWNESIREHVSILSSNGYFGIGTTTPAYKLHVAGDIYTTTGFKKNGSSDSYVLLGGGGHKLESSLNVASASVASKVYGQVGDTGTHELVRCDMNNDQFRIIAGSNGNNNGWAEIATADDGSEPIYVRQYTGVFSSVVRTLTLLDANGYTHFPSYISIGGNENNNSSPDRVWGSNGSDSYLRSYRTSALNVNYAASAGNADTVDGYHASSGNKPWGTIPVITTLGFMDIGNDLEFHYDNTTGSDYSTALMCQGNYNNTVYLPSASGTLALTSDIPNPTNYYWANIKISDSSSTTTSPTVSNLTATNSIRMGNISLEHTYEINNITNGGIYLNYRNSGNVSLCQGGGNVSIGYSSPSYKLDVNGSAHIGGTLIINSILNLLEVGAIRVANKTIINIGSDGVDFLKGVSFNDTVSFLKSINIRTGLTEYNAKEYSTSNHSVIIAECLNNTTFIFEPAGDGLLLFMKLGKKYSNIKIQCTARDCIVVKADNFNILIGRNTTLNIYGDGVSRFFIYEAIPNRWIEFRCG